MVDSEAVRSRRKRLHAAGDHSECRSCLETPARQARRKAAPVGGSIVATIDAVAASHPPLGADDPKGIWLTCAREVAAQLDADMSAPQTPALIGCLSRLITAVDYRPVDEVDERMSRIVADASVHEAQHLLAYLRRN